MSGSATSSSSKPRDIQADEFKNLRPDVASAIRAILSSGGGPQFEGPFAAPIGFAETEELARLNALSQGSPFSAPVQDLLTGTLRGDFLDPASNPALQQNINTALRLIEQDFSENELLDRALFSRAGQQIQESSPFSRARAIATQSRENAASDVVGRLIGENFQAERNRQQGAVDQTRALVQQKFDNATANLQAQALPRLIAQLGIDAGRDEFNRRMAMLRDVLGIGAGATQPAIGQKSKSSAAGGGIAPGIFESRGGGGGE